ncbi:cation:proton antiporter [Fulvivirga maritima]|uniref:cation:proton antiporter n=1 Tax=Fulvivirga maritima TaxID=2904247 RepID=UPI001F1895A2|nr:cation:proton antiporter [Fulvivirga maritima]UII28532.1 cation:proton antiporter [Fulvivirga maritima]
MDITLTLGLILIIGYLLGKIARTVGLPKVSGYIIAGIVLNPNLTHIIDSDFPDITEPVTNICLAFITMEVGSTLSFSKIKKSGKGILSITIFEAFFAFLFVLIGFLVVTPLAGIDGLEAMVIPFSLLVASLASPTDPSSTLAVAHEYKAKGEVSDTIMGVAAFDDAVGILIFSLSTGIALIFVDSSNSPDFGSILLEIVRSIGGAIIIGIISGALFNLFTRFFKVEGDQIYIILILGFLSMCFGLAVLFGVEELMSTMVFGAIIVNYNPKEKQIFEVLQRYTEELIFIIFFTVSGMHLDFSVLSSAMLLILIFFILRAVGKFAGVWLGATISKMPLKVKKYTAGGLIPQGGIVIGLALLMQKNENYHDIAPLIIGTIMGATILHELIGPLLAKITLKKAGEIKD